MTSDARVICEGLVGRDVPERFIWSRFGHFNRCEGGGRQGDPSPVHPQRRDASGETPEVQMAGRRSEAGRNLLIPDVGAGGTPH